MATSFESRTFLDRRGDVFLLVLYRVEPGTPSTTIPAVASAMAEIADVGRLAFPNYTDSQLERYVVKKLDNAAHFALVHGSNGRLVGFQINKVGRVQCVNGTESLILYLDQAAFHPSYQGRGLLAGTVDALLDIDSPGAVCTSSGNANVHRSLRRVAEQRTLVVQPPLDGTAPPESVFQFAERIHDALALRNAQLSPRLVRTYDGPVTRGERWDFLLDGILQLNERQHCFFLGLTTETWIKVLADAS